uniref:leucine-rich repeat protein n=1 Tax=Butyrivibrio sp. WCE2006 TaxID=1410611 RepID=UPI0005D1C680
PTEANITAAKKAVQDALDAKVDQDELKTANGKIKNAETAKAIVEAETAAKAADDAPSSTTIKTAEDKIEAAKNAGATDSELKTANNYLNSAIEKLEEESKKATKPENTDNKTGETGTVNSNSVKNEKSKNVGESDNINNIVMPVEDDSKNNSDKVSGSGSSTGNEEIVENETGAVSVPTGGTVAGAGSESTGGSGSGAGGDSTGGSAAGAGSDSTSGSESVADNESASGSESGAGSESESASDAEESTDAEENSDAEQNSPELESNEDITEPEHTVSDSVNDATGNASSDGETLEEDEEQEEDEFDEDSSDDAVQDANDNNQNSETLANHTGEDNSTEQPSGNTDEASQEEENVSRLPMTVTVEGITYHIGVDAKARVLKIGDMNSASINTVTVDGVTYPVIEIEPNACTKNKKLKKLSIGLNVMKIGRKSFYKCKKLKSVKIKANKKLKVESSAFKKIHSSAVIKVKGLKGSKKNKLVKKIRKQTNALVK